MFQGTGSDVGKSLMVAGLARALTNRGLKVRPFKPQNMSNNAAVTADGGEIGRAQALQARAARVPASVHMNPVLLKPQSEIGAQVVVQGRVFASAKAAAYQQMKRDLLPYVLESFGRLRAEADIVLVEGAGSAAEVNLRKNDIANMGFARAASVPVVLIGDIDRGGVIASLVGTKAVIAPDDAALAQLQQHGVAIEPAPVRALHGEGAQLAAIELGDGRTAGVDALYLGPRTHLNSEIAQQLGCELDEGVFGSIIRTDDTKMTTVSGVYAAGDITRSAHNVTWASADGVTAGMAVHRSLVF